MSSLLQAQPINAAFCHEALMSVILSALAFVSQRAAEWRAERFVKLAIPPSHKLSKSVSTACQRSQETKLQYITELSETRRPSGYTMRTGGTVN